MTARVLDYTEWDRLPGYMDEVLVHLRPGTSRICVVENEQGEIVGRWALYPVLFAEDLWIHPDHRQKVSVGRQLWRLVHRCAAELGFTRMVSTITDGELAGLVARAGAETMPAMVTYPVRELSSWRSHPFRKQ